MKSQDMARSGELQQSTGEVISVLLVDQHPLTRAGVRSILELETDFEVLAEAASVEEALEACQRRRPDVVLLDVETASANLAGDVERLRAAGAGAALVVLSHEDSDSQLFQAALSGAAGLVAAAAEPADLALVIGRAARGEQPIERQLEERPRVGQRVLEAYQQLVAQGAEAEPLPTLDERELAVLSLAAEGLTNAQIGSRLGLSGNTVKSVVSGILARLGLRYRTQAVVHALREGWIEAPFSR